MRNLEKKWGLIDTETTHTHRELQFLTELERLKPPLAEWKSYHATHPLVKRHFLGVIFQDKAQRVMANPEGANKSRRTAIRLTPFRNALHPDEGKISSAGDSINHSVSLSVGPSTFQRYRKYR